MIPCRSYEKASKNLGVLDLLWYFVLVFYCFISSFIAVYTVKSLHTLIVGKDSKSRQQMSPVLSIKGGKASTEHSVSGTTGAKRKSDPQDRKLH